MSKTIERAGVKKVAAKGAGSTEKAQSGVIAGLLGQIKGPGLSAAQIIEGISGGLPIQDLNLLQTNLDVPMERLAPKLGISRATLHRRIAEGRLEPGESDRLVRFAKLMGKAVEVFETTQNARRWLTSPQIGLGGAVPLDYAETEVGAREVEDLLGRIEYGVYS